MIEALMALMAFFGCGKGGAEQPYTNTAFNSDNHQIIRAIDSNELMELNALEAHDADKWFV